MTDTPFGVGLEVGRVAATGKARRKRMEKDEARVGRETQERLREEFLRRRKGDVVGTNEALEGARVASPVLRRVWDGDMSD